MADDSLGLGMTGSAEAVASYDRAGPTARYRSDGSGDSDTSGAG